MIAGQSGNSWYHPEAHWMVGSSPAGRFRFHKEHCGRVLDEPKGTHFTFSWIWRAMWWLPRWPEEAELASRLVHPSNLMLGPGRMEFRHAPQATLSLSGFSLPLYLPASCLSVTRGREARDQSSLEWKPSKFSSVCSWCAPSLVVGKSRTGWMRQTVQSVWLFETLKP